MHTAQHQRDQKRACIGMCKRCGEAYADIGTTAQRKAWMASHGEACTREPETVDVDLQAFMLKVLLAMPADSPAH
jgi:hypothetical protein